MPQKQNRITCWYQLKNDPLGGEVEVVHLLDDETAAIREEVECARHFFDPDKGSMRQETKINTILDRKLTAVRSVVKWKNFKDAAGQEMECNRENKEFWACDNDFTAQLRGFRLKLAIEAVKQMEAALGNLSSSASGSPASDDKTAIPAEKLLPSETENPAGM